MLQHLQLCPQVQAATSLLSSPSSSMAVKHGPCLLTLKKRIQAFKTKCWRKLFHISCLEHKTNDWVGSRINFLEGPQEPLLATVKRWKHLGMSHTMTAFFKTILQGTLEVGWHCGWEDMLDRQHQSVDIPCPCQNCSQGPPAEKTGRGSLLQSLMSPWWPNRPRDWTELNWLNSFLVILNGHIYIDLKL